MSLISYVKTTTNNRLLISQSHGDSNWCTPCRGKLDQHATRLPRLVCVWPSTIHISCGPHIATFRESPTDLDGSHCSQEKWLPTQSTAHRLIDPRVHTQFLSKAKQWSKCLKPSLCRGQATRLIGPISPPCDRYVQYMLVGAKPSVLNRHRWGPLPLRCRLSTYHSLTFLTKCLHFPPNDTTQSPV
jgi:hypothetical protein